LSEEKEVNQPSASKTIESLERTVVHGQKKELSLLPCEFDAKPLGKRKKEFMMQ
jgi:hypothetical protein